MERNAWKRFSKVHLSELNKVCSFECTERRENNPSIVQQSPNTFILSNLPNGTVIYCEDRKTKTTTLFAELPPTDYGAKEVRLSASCYVKIPGVKKVVRCPYPCPYQADSEPRVHNILPAIWSKVDAVLLSEDAIAKVSIIDPDTFTNIYSDLDSCLNTSWQYSVDTLNITEIAELSHSTIPKLLHVVPTVSSLILYLWDIPLAFAVGYLLLQMFIVKRSRAAMTAAAPTIIPLLQNIPGASADSLFSENSLSPGTIMFYQAISVIILVCLVVGVCTCFCVTHNFLSKLTLYSALCRYIPCCKVKRTYVISDNKV